MESLIKQLELKDKGFYILTNTRTFPEPQAVRIMHNVIQNLSEAAKETNISFSTFRFISRGDSTLRGHYPAETQAIMDADKSTVYHGLILCPAFFGGGRVTIDDVHYLKEKNRLTPVAETPFAKDPHFGFQSSNLKDWIIEKTKGSVKASQIISFSLQELRNENEEYVAHKLQTAPKDAVIIVNGINCLNSS